MGKDTQTQIHTHLTNCLSNEMSVKRTANNVISAAADFSVSSNAVSSPKSSARATDNGSTMEEPAWKDKSSIGAGTAMSGTGGNEMSATADTLTPTDVRLASAVCSTDGNGTPLTSSTATAAVDIRDRIPPASASTPETRHTISV